jgi:hypothetical protein
MINMASKLYNTPAILSIIKNGLSSKATVITKYKMPKPSSS